MTSFLAAVAMMMSWTVLASTPTAQTAQRMQTAHSPEPGQSSSACTQEGNVDSCWQAGVAAEKRSDAGAALANYERSCAAGFQMGGCYEAGKIYFLDPSRRNYSASKDRMARVCNSDDVGIGPYACKYLGIIYRNGLAGKPQPDRAFLPLSRSCFLHNTEPFIDGSGCEILGESLPSADEMGLSDRVWQRAYIAYLAFAMGCTDDMPALCSKAQAIHRRAVAASASWLKRCVEDLEAAAFSGSCEELAVPATARYEQRQALRRQLVRMFRKATENSA